MTLVDFGRKLKDHKTLSLCDIVEEDGTTWLTIKNEEKEDGRQLTVASVHNNPWEHLEPVLLDLKASSLMVHITRIVGYYSRLANWSPSKLAELDDRHKGNYTVPGAARD